MSLSDLNAERIKNNYEDFGTIDRDDLADNLNDHYESKIRPFADETNLSFGQVINLFSPYNYETNRDSHYKDATLDCMSKKGLRFAIHSGIPGSPLNDFFMKGNESYILGVAYLQNIFSACLDFSAGRLSETSKEYINIINSNYLQALSRPFNPEDIGELEIDRNYMPRVRIQDVIAVRRTIFGSKYQGPEVTNLGNSSLKVQSEGASSARYGVKTAEGSVDLVEIGYELAIDDKTRRSTVLTMDMLTEIQVQKSYQTEDEIVNYLINSIATDKDGLLLSEEPGFVDYSDRNFSGEDITDIHSRARGPYRITTVMGELPGIVKYVSAHQAIASGDPTQGGLSSIFGLEKIARKDEEEVKAFEGDGIYTAAFDRRNTIDYIVEQQGTVTEIYPDHQVRSLIISNSHSFAGNLRREADPGQTRWIISY